GAMTVRHRWAGVASALACVLLPATVAAQGVRGNAVTAARYYELRPIAPDTVPFADVEQRANGTFEFEGLPISCIQQSHCIRYRALDKQSAVLLTQDLGFTAWGFGVEGLSTTVQLRARAGL